ncbi:CLUMA_CG018855, isoform A [Clunio marinus]|uniref:Carbonic anhydrase n=1 Tax=Clunio marinus TaxID=568069 RepID=A0A1J1J232_9DIPT|nr:CLUMA_CG018855, isoform A [Clunio marinus]
MFLTYFIFLLCLNNFAHGTFKKHLNIYDRLNKYNTKHPNILEKGDESNIENFSYDYSDPFGPRNWGRLSRNCDGNRQSPINLPLGILKSRIGKPLTFSDFSTTPKSIKVINDGHSVKVEFNFPGNDEATISGGPLVGKYKIDNVHWHWGEKDNCGSEHLLNGRRFSAELHIVTYDSRYSTNSINDAVDKRNGIAVLGFFYELTTSNRASDFPLTDKIQDVIEPESSCTETSDVFTFRDLIKSTRFDYLTYKGSLTTPTCDETVTWIVSTNPLKISSNDLGELRKLRDKRGNLILRNYRPIQSSKLRLVERYRST